MPQVAYPDLAEGRGRLRLWHVLVAVGIGPFVLCVGPCMIPVIIDDLRFARYKRDIAAIGVPSESVVLGRTTEFENLAGTGNSCHYRVRLFVATKLSDSDFRAFWAPHRIDFDVDDTMEGQRYVTAQVQAIKKGTELDRLGGEIYKGETPEGYRATYLVEFWASHEAGLDWRCH